MNKFTKSAFILGMLLSGSMWASTYQWLTFKMTDDTEVSVAAENLLIHYVGETLQLKSATVDESLQVANIRSMMFTSTAAGVADPCVGFGQSADYYILSGERTGHFISIEDARKQLPSGIYIVKSKTKTFKIIF